MTRILTAHTGTRAGRGLLGGGGGGDGGRGGQRRLAIRGLGDRVRVGLSAI